MEVPKRRKNGTDRKGENEGTGIERGRENGSHGAQLKSEADSRLERGERNEGVDGGRGLENEGKTGESEKGREDGGPLGLGRQA